MRINQSTVDLVKRWEGFRGRSYLCPAGVWTVGYGTTSQAGIGVKVGPDMVVTRDQAETWLRQSLDVFAAKIRPAITAPINENEFGAFLSLAYNIGVGAFLGSSALRHFNAGDKAKAASSIRLWNKATVNGKRKVLKGLVDRRADEVKLFTTPVATAPLTSTPVAASAPPQAAIKTPSNAEKPATPGIWAAILAWLTGARQ